jgi:RNA polymerase sigma factor (sigma-70 family)
MMTVSLRPDTDVVIRAQQGDEQAITALLRASQPDLRRYARRACRVEDVDDAVQETLTILVRKVSGLRHPAALAGWLHAVVTRQCARLMRSTARLWQPLDASEDRVAALPDHELRRDLAAAIQSLPDNYRTVVIHRDLEGMTMGEIARAEGTSIDAVKGRLRRARALLREYLSAQ